MAESFQFLSTAEFHRLCFKAQLAYLNEAKAHMERSNRGNYRWGDLFNQPCPQEPAKT